VEPPEGLHFVAERDALLVERSELAAQGEGSIAFQTEQGGELLGAVGAVGQRGEAAQQGGVFLAQGF